MIFARAAKHAQDAVDMRNLAQMLAHVHDAEIEIGEGPEPALRDQHIRKPADRWS